VVQRIKTRLYPISGLDVEPDFVADLYIDDRIQRTMGYLLARTDNGSVLVEGTSAGAIKVADIGSGFEAYEVETGTAADTYTGGNTYEYTDARASWDLKLDSTSADISFQNAAGSWGGNIWLNAGTASIDVSAYGIKIKNHTSGDNTVYQIVSWK
jgi:hypothetical protein